MVLKTKQLGNYLSHDTCLFGVVGTDSEHKNNPLLSLGETAKTKKNIFLFFHFDSSAASYDVWIF